MKYNSFGVHVAVALLAVVVCVQSAGAQITRIKYKSIKHENHEFEELVSAGEALTFHIAPGTWEFQGIPDDHVCRFTFWQYGTVLSDEPDQNFAEQSGTAVAWYVCSKRGTGPTTQPNDSPPKLTVQVYNRIAQEFATEDMPALKDASPPEFASLCTSAHCFIDMIRGADDNEVAIQSITAHPTWNFEGVQRHFRHWWILSGPSAGSKVFDRTMHIEDAQHTHVFAVYAEKRPRNDFDFDFDILIDLQLLPFVIENACLVLIGDPELCGLIDTDVLKVVFQGLEGVDVELTMPDGTTIARAQLDARGLTRTLTITADMVRQANGLDSLGLRFSRSRQNMRSHEVDLRQYVDVRVISVSEAGR